MATKSESARVTSKIGLMQAETIFHAVRYATDRGRPINAHVTLNFHRLGVPEGRAGPLFRDLRSRFARSWRYRAQTGVPLGSLDDVHAHENPEGVRNVHWALHIPPEYWDWAVSQVEKLLLKVLAIDDAGDALKITSAKTPGGLAKYILKGVQSDAADYFHMQDYIAPQGLVSGRRTGTSRSIGRRARRAAQWKRTKRPRPTK